MGFLAWAWAGQWGLPVPPTHRLLQPVPRGLGFQAVAGYKAWLGKGLACLGARAGAWAWLGLGFGLAWLVSWLDILTNILRDSGIFSNILS